MSHYSWVTTAGSTLSSRWPATSSDLVKSAKCGRSMQSLGSINQTITLIPHHGAKKGAGPVSVNLIHDIDLMRHFCGEVVAVQAQFAAAKRGYENEDLGSAILRFASGAIGTVTVSDSIASPWSWEFTSGENPAYPSTQQSTYFIGGSEGSISVPDLRVWRHDGDLDWWNPMQAERAQITNIDPLINQMIHFRRVILGLETPWSRVSREPRAWK